MSAYTFKTEVIGLEMEVIGILYDSEDSMGNTRQRFEIDRIVYNGNDIVYDQIDVDILTDIEQRAIVQLDKEAAEGHEYENH